MRKMGRDERTEGEEECEDGKREKKKGGGGK